MGPLLCLCVTLIPSGPITVGLFQCSKTRIKIVYQSLGGSTIKIASEEKHLMGIAK